jgi:hypothetical protein
MERPERLCLCFERLNAAPAAANYPENRELLTAIWNRVEDEHSGVPYNPDNWSSDGRMYPPSEDQRQPMIEEHKVVFHSRGHRITFFHNGRIIIEVRRGSDRGKTVLDKPGKG